MKAYILAKDQYAEPIKNVVADLKEMGFEIIESKPITRPKTPSVIPTWGKTSSRHGKKEY